MSNINVILASASPARLATLRNAGVSALPWVSHVDEREIERAHPEYDAPATVMALAEAKARKIATLLGGMLADDTMGAAGQKTDLSLAGLDGAAAEINALLSARGDSTRWVIIGCDSMLLKDGQLLGKPESIAEAQEKVWALRRSSPVLYSGHYVCVLAANGCEIASARGCSSATVNFADFTREEALAYVETGEPLHVAGGFTIDGLGGPFIDSIEGDPHGIVGISLPLLRQLLSEVGVAWPQLWQD